METANGTTAAQNGSQSENGDYKLKFCTVCASNNNRSVQLRGTHDTVFPNLNLDPWKLISDSRKPTIL